MLRALLGILLPDPVLVDVAVVLRELGRREVVLLLLNREEESAETKQITKANKS